MDLNELFQRLSYGEFRNLNLANSGNGTIDTAEQPMIVLYANEALTKLHTRFLLKESSLLLEPVGYLTAYPLLKANAQSAKDPENPNHVCFIQDQFGEPFQQDVLKILSVWNIWGCELPLNDEERADSLFTPQPHVLQLPHARTGQVLSVIYQANHPKLLADNPEQEIQLPDYLTNALTSYIAHKVFGSINTQENNAKAAEHLSNFETICGETVQQGLISTASSTSGRRFVKHGWV